MNNKRLKTLLKILKKILLFIIVFYCILVIIGETEVYTLSIVAKKIIAATIIFIIAKVYELKGEI